MEEVPEPEPGSGETIQSGCGRRRSTAVICSPPRGGTMGHA